MTLTIPPPAIVELPEGIHVELEFQGRWETGNLKYLTPSETSTNKISSHLVC